MKVGIDLRHISAGRSGGIAPLLKGVLEALFRACLDDQFVVFCTIFNRSLLDIRSANVKAVSLPAHRYTAEVDRLAADEQIEVIFRSYPTEDDLAFPSARQIVLIPDLQHEVFPEFFAPGVLRVRRAAFHRALVSAGAIGTISEHARRTLLDHPGRRCADIFLMPPALTRSDADGGPLSPDERQLVPPGDFFLYPANLWPHKNHRRILEAFGRFLEQTGSETHLVLTGHPDGWPALRDRFPSLPVRHLGFVRPRVLEHLLAKARALVFFSLYEGFGMPLLEAFAAGIPVICSDTTSLPEVGGDAVLSCDPTDVAAMSGLMTRIARDAALRADLVARGRRRLAAHSWDASARSLGAALRRVAAGGSAAAPASGDAAGRAPLVSIVTPSFNQGRFLGRTIESVLGQTYPRIEYLVMDGGSRDESKAILESYGDRFVWRSEPDAGQTDAINKGFARSRGEIRGYVNSDDVLLPGAVERVVAFFQDHPEVDMVYGTAEYIDEKDRSIGAYRTVDYSFPALMRDCIVCQPAAFWRTRIAERVGPFDEALHFAMDYDYWLRIARADGVIAHIPDRLARSRLHPDTKTLSARARIYDEIFRVCMVHGGYVDRDFLLGYWDHLCRERQTGWPHRLRKVPGFYTVMVHAHHAWINRGRYTPRRIAQALGRRCRDALRRLTAATPPLQRVARRLAQLATGRRPAVSGYWGDNWLAPTTRILLRPGPPGHEYYLAGTAPVDLVLRVTAGATPIGEYPLTAHRCERITFRTGHTAETTLSLRFSGSAVDPAGRRLAFLLEDTNLFAEEDVS